MRRRIIVQQTPTSIFAIFGPNTAHQTLQNSKVEYRIKVLAGWNKLQVTIL